MIVQTSFPSGETHPIPVTTTGSPLHSKCTCRPRNTLDCRHATTTASSPTTNVAALDNASRGFNQVRSVSLFSFAGGDTLDTADPAVFVMLFAVLSQQKVSRELRPGTCCVPGYVAPTCESRFKAPLHTALAGEAFTPRPRRYPRKEVCCRDLFHPRSRSASGAASHAGRCE